MNFLEQTSPQTTSPTLQENKMARKKVDDYTASIALALGVLKPLNDALYQTSGELDPLLALCTSARSNEDMHSVINVIEMICRHMSEKSELLYSIATSIKKTMDEASSASEETTSNTKH